MAAVEMSVEVSSTEPVSSIPAELQERYTHWKKNTKLLYDYLNTNSNKWPSLTCELFPDVDLSNDTHRLLLSSFTSSQLAEGEAVYISKISTMNHLFWSSLNNFDMDEMEFKPDNSTVKLPPKNLTTEIMIQFPHGDCNRARYMPQNPDLIAAGSSDGSIYIFDRSKHGKTFSSRQTSMNSTAYQARFRESETQQVDIEVESPEVLSLEWNREREGLLASTYLDGNFKVWDIKKFSKANPTISKTAYKQNLDDSPCNDATWMPGHDSIIAACTENNLLQLLDIRSAANKKPVISFTNNCSHQDGINACRFNPQNSLILASADSNGTVNLWDVRNSNKPFTTLLHGSSIGTIEWAPLHDTILATAGQDDGLVKLWDVATQTTIFTHGGHMLGINDIAWDYHDPWLLASVSKDNAIHIWKPAKNLVEAVE